MLYRDLDVPYAKELKKAFKRVGLPYERVVSGWRESASGKDDDFKETISDNLDMLEKLGRKSGILAHRFNIFCFDRYPVELLERLYEERDRTDKPPAIAIVGRWDYRFNLFSVGVSLDMLASSLKGNYLRVFEASNARQMDSALQRVKTLYGNEQVAELGGFYAHSSESGVRLGAGARERFSVNHLTRARMELFKSVFVPEPTFFLMGCSAGAEGGMAQRLSLKAEARTFGADNVSWPIMVTPIKIEGQEPFWMPIYAGVDGTLVNSMEYYRGERVVSPLKISVSYKRVDS